MGDHGPHPCNASLTRGSDKKGNHGHLAIELRCPFRSAPVSGVIIDEKAVCDFNLAQVRWTYVRVVAIAPGAMVNVPR